MRGRIEQAQAGIAVIYFGGPAQTAYTFYFLYEHFCKNIQAEIPETRPSYKLRAHITNTHAN